MIETDMSQVVRGIAGDQIKKMIPLKRIGKPEEIAARGGLPGQRRRLLPDGPGAAGRRRPEPGRILSDIVGRGLAYTP